MPFTPKVPTALFSTSRRRQSYAAEESEILASDSSHPHHPAMQPSASTSWINPFGRASFSVESADDAYVPPGSLPTSRRPSAATIITTLLHSVGSNIRGSQDGSSSGVSDDASNGSKGQQGSSPPALAASTGRRPSAILKAWKARRGSQSTQATPPSPVPPPTGSLGFAQRRRRSSALTRVLQPSALRNNTTTRVDEHHSLATDDSASDARRSSLSIVCRGERDSADLDPIERFSHAPQHSGKTAAMAIRDTWLYGEHQWREDGRKGSVSTVATSPTCSMPPGVGRKSFSVAVGLDEEDRLQETRMRGKKMPDALSVVSLSLTEEIALYTTDVGAEEKEKDAVAGDELRDRRGTAVATEGAGGFVWNMPDWGSSRRGSRLPMLSPAPAVMIADPCIQYSKQGAGSASMQRVESGALDPMPFPAASYTPTSEGASDGHGSMHRRSSAVPAPAVQWAQPQWNAASPFNPNAPAARRPSFAAAGSFNSVSTPSYHSTDDQSPTAPNFPPPATPAIAIVQPTSAAAAEDTKRRATTYYDTSPLPIVDEIPRSPTSEFPPPSFRPSTSATTVSAKSPRSPRSPRSPHSPLSSKSPKSPKSFGYSETYEMASLQRRKSYSLPRPPTGYAAPSDDDASSHMPTPRLVEVEFGETAPSPMSSNFAPETPSGGATFPELQMEKKEEGDDLHAQFCSVLLLDLGDGTAIPLSPSPSDEPRPDPFALLAF